MTAEPELPPYDEGRRYADLVRLTGRMFPNPVEEFLLLMYASVEAAYHDWAGRPDSFWLDESRHGHVWGLMFNHGRQRNWYFGINQPPPDGKPVRLVGFTSEGAWTLNHERGRVWVTHNGALFEQPPELAGLDPASDEYLFTLSCCILIAVVSGNRISFKL